MKMLSSPHGCRIKSGMTAFLARHGLAHLSLRARPAIHGVTADSDEHAVLVGRAEIHVDAGDAVAAESQELGVAE